MKMRKVELNMKEQTIYQAIKKLVETGDNKKSVAIKLGCTLRNINLLIKKYKEKGKAGFSHGNKHRQPKITLSSDIRKRVLDLYHNKYYGFNWQHFLEKLNTTENIKISYFALYKLLTSAGYISPYAFKATKKKRQKELEAKKKLSEVDKRTIQDNYLLDKADAHPRKPRAKYFGELIQMDASSLIWFDDVFATLHLAVDDSTGEVVGAYFTPQETLFGYYNVLYQILTNYGVPSKFLTDNRTVFIYKQKKNPIVEEDTYTQFGYACKQLGIEISTSSVAQVKGRIERLNGTFQRRLPQELRIANIHTIEQANEFLKSYLKEFNARFALHHNDSTSVFANKPSIQTINNALAIIAPRKFDSGSSIKFNGNYYQAVEHNVNNVMTFKKGVEALVIKTFDDRLIVGIGEKTYPLIKLNENKQFSTNFDIQTKTDKKQKSIHVPPMSHPWKRASFIQYLNNIKHQQSSANV